jgi:hypothetical protein
MEVAGELHASLRLCGYFLGSALEDFPMFEKEIQES